MRVLKGYATTSDVDAVGDIVKPQGVRFTKMPLPLLGGHDHKLPIGTVVAATPDSKGVLITAHLFPKGESQIADHWAAAAKYGAATAFSIGFRSSGGKANSHGGVTYDSSLVHEVSLVIAPANSACVATYTETPSAAAKPTANAKPQPVKPAPGAKEAVKRMELLRPAPGDTEETIKRINEKNEFALLHNLWNGLISQDKYTMLQPVFTRF